jgi:hypothetical protein
MSFHYSALKAPLRVVIQLLISLKPVRLLGKRLIDANPFLRAQRSHVEEARFSKICHSLFREKTVLNGPFKGLFYLKLGRRAVRFIRNYAGPMRMSSIRLWKAS